MTLYPRTTTILILLASASAASSRHGLLAVQESPPNGPAAALEIPPRETADPGGDLEGHQLLPDGSAGARLEEIRSLRLRGALDDARTLAERALSEARTSSAEEVELHVELHLELHVELHLELARIHDRVGLHHNSRPVEQALAEIVAAEALIERPSARLQGAVELAKGDYYYRAEIGERQFPTALEHIEEAIRLLESAGDTRRLAEAVHRLGLIRMQRRELSEARRLFDRSLELDDSAGRRDYFHGEYHRHVGFVYWLSDDIAAALPHFRRSLDFRRGAGAIDASLFAAVSLGSALVETGAPAAAEEPLLYALRTARELESPVGTARAAIALGAMHTALEDPISARAAYELARDRALAVGLDSIVTRAREALQALANHPSPSPR